MEAFYDHPLNLVLDIGNMLFSLSVFLFLIYTVQAQSFKSRTSKYKFVSQHEGKAMRGAAILLSLAVGFYTFVLLGLTIGVHEKFGYMFNTLVSVVIGYGLGYVLWQYMTYYHPFILEKRLNDIRFGPMQSPDGHEMVLLNEEQEDIHLTKEMIEEEDTLSVDYDVWLDKLTNYKVIEKYDTRFHPEICDSCNFRTLLEKNEEVVIAPQEHKRGLLRKHYECSYCGHMELKDIEIPSWEEEKHASHHDHPEHDHQLV